MSWVRRRSLRQTGQLNDRAAPSGSAGRNRPTMCARVGLALSEPLVRHFAGAPSETVISAESGSIAADGPAVSRKVPGSTVH